MYQMVVLVLARPEQLQQIADAWRDAGVSGMTVLHSVGMEGLRKHPTRDDVPLFPSMRDLLELDELHHRTIFTLAEDDALIDRLIAATEQIIGPMANGNNGILFTVPIGRIRGLPRRS
ncbi:MAG TPA: hypothetical protein PKA05_10445 [Roseiflexaceae bacterium]|nr:hypothetical protein [Roseiflexaceae bacterium]HMP40788.1 hypothetical protein [Roseiflexaceae bacterium]